MSDEGVFLYGARRLLLLLHAGASVVLIGAATHHAWLMRHYLAGRFAHERLEKTYAKVVSAAYAVTFAIGALLYPTYRVHVRALHLDRHLSTYVYANWFDLKEIYASLALPLALALGVLAARLRPAESRPITRVYAVTSLVVCGVVWLNVIVGIVVVSVRGIG